MKEERLILVTNDDGYDSKGLAAAVEVARGFGRVVVVAPETTQSGMSQAITMYNPLYLRCVRKEEGLEVYAFSGHAGRLREDGVRLPAARRARRSGDFGH